MLWKCPGDAVKMLWKCLGNQGTRWESFGNVGINFQDSTFSPLTLDLAALVLARLAAFLGSEVVLNPFVSLCATVEVGVGELTVPGLLVTSHSIFFA